MMSFLWSELIFCLSDLGWTVACVSCWTLVWWHFFRLLDRACSLIPVFLLLLVVEGTVVVATTLVVWVCADSAWVAGCSLAVANLVLDALADTPTEELEAAVSLAANCVEHALSDGPTPLAQ